MAYVPSVQDAIDYIEDNLTGPISLQTAAERAGYSVPHFYRLFKAMTGGTVGAYVLRRRLALAADALRTGHRTVADVAYAFGFESHDVFTRAFQRVYGMPPSRYRRTGGCPALAPVVPACPAPAPQSQSVRFEVITQPAVAVVGMRCSAAEWDADGAIGRLWSAFLPRVEEIAGIASPVTMYGVCEPGPAEPGRFYYLAAVGVMPGTGASPAGMVSRVIPARTWVRADVPETLPVPDAYTQTLDYARRSGFAIAHGDFIEVYEETFRDPADHRFQLLIPIE